MTTPIPDPAQWLARLFRPETVFPAQLQEMATHVAALQQDYFRQITALWPAAALTDKPAPQDKRFTGEAWRADPRFEVATRSYLAYSSLLHDAIAAAPLDERTKRQWEFVARQLVDALSPANFLGTNPEAMQLVVESGGKSLVDGMGLLVQDLLKGRITMTDETAFELGRNIATTSGSVIFENELMQLIRYTPLTARVHKRPLLVVPPCINKFYILDLQPDSSLVRYALAQGHQVYLVSWRSATPAMEQLTWDDYLESGVVQAINVVLEAGGSDKLNALGFCIGGTLLACAAAVERARGEARVASLTLLTAMLDFTDTGELGLLVDEQSVAKREQEIGTRGVLHGTELALTFSSLRANDLIWPYVVNSYLKGKAPAAFDLLYWNADSTNLPGPMYCWYLRNTYLENKLASRAARCNAACPSIWGRSTCRPTCMPRARTTSCPGKPPLPATAIGRRHDFVLGASGHIAGVINPASKNKRNHWVNKRGGHHPSGDADQWLAGATDVPGSWWPHWSAWLARHAGPMVAAPKTRRAANTGQSNRPRVVM